MTELKNYFYNDFPAQLHNITDKKKPEGFDDKYVFIGGPQWENFENDIKKIPAEDQPVFIVSLFMIIFSDQAFYTYISNLYHLWQAMTEFPKFGHFGTGPHNENPLWILAKADTDAELSQKVQALMPEFVKFLVDETKSYFTRMFGNHIDLSQYFKIILGDGGYQGGYQLKSNRPETEELRNSKCVAMFKQLFENELKAQGFI